MNKVFFEGTFTKEESIASDTRREGFSIDSVQRYYHNTAMAHLNGRITTPNIESKREATKRFRFTFFHFFEQPESKSSENEVYTFILQNRV